MVKAFRYLIIALIFIGLWQLATMFGGYSPLLLPSPIAVFHIFFTELLDGSLTQAVLYSVYIIVKGLVFALILGVILLMVSMIKPWGQDIVSFLVTIAHPLPGIAILPLVILWAGIGEKALLIIIVHSMMWPLVITLKERLENLIHDYERLGKAFNLSLRDKAYHIYAMGAVPSVITGGKIAWSRGWRAFISSEMIFGIVGQNGGLGWYLFEQRVYMNSQKLFAGLLAVIICGVLIENMVFQPIELAVNRRWRS
jgi:NitT/TauT family transport system permease protein